MNFGGGDIVVVPGAIEDFRPGIQFVQTVTFGDF